MSATERDGSDPLYETRYERTSREQPSTTVAVAVHRALEGEDESVPVLANSIDPDALDSLFAWPRATDDWCLRFSHAGAEVVVSGDGTVRVET